MDRDQVDFDSNHSGVYVSESKIMKKTKSIEVPTAAPIVAAPTKAPFVTRVEESAPNIINIYPESSERGHFKYEPPKISSDINTSTLLLILAVVAVLYIIICLHMLNVNISNNNRLLELLIYRNKSDAM